MLLVVSNSTPPTTDTNTHTNIKTPTHNKNKTNKLGYSLDRPALQVVFQRFDPTRSGQLGLAEFLALTLFLRSATATFNAFDPGRTGFVRVNFNQFLCAFCFGCVCVLMCSVCFLRRIN